MRKSECVVVVTSIALLGGTCQALAGGGGVIAGTSFEEPGIFAGVQYRDTGDASTDHQLFNNADEPFVEYAFAGGELGFTAWYVNTRNDVGLTDGDFVGVTDFVGDVGAYTDGTQGYELSDADGMMRVILDTVDLTGLGSAQVTASIDYFVNETGWEAGDLARIYVRTNDGTLIDILNTSGSDIDDLGIEDRWITGIADLTGYSSATLVAELDSNAAAEALYLDQVIFSVVPTPAPLALLGLATLLGGRRRRR